MLTWPIRVANPIEQAAAAHAPSGPKVCSFDPNDHESLVLGLRILQSFGPGIPHLGQWKFGQYVICGSELLIGIVIARLHADQGARRYSVKPSAARHVGKAGVDNHALFAQLPIVYIIAITQHVSHVICASQIQQPTTGLQESGILIYQYDLTNIYIGLQSEIQGEIAIP